MQPRPGAAYGYGYGGYGYDAAYYDPSYGSAQDVTLMQMFHVGMSG